MNGITEQELQQYLFQYESELFREAETLSLSDFPALIEELFSLFEKTGNRLQYEDAYFGRRKYLVVFALNALLAKEQGIPAEFSRLEWVLEQICEETCWALPAHVNRKQDAEWEITLDLFACETAQSLLEIAFLLQNDLRTDLLRRIWEESSRRVLQPFLRHEEDGFWWEKSESNWNAVCCGSVGAAACYASALLPLLCPDAGSIEQNREQCEQILTRVTQDLSCFLASFSEDGACMEGLGYWEYGMSYFSMFAELLKEKTGGKTDLLEGEKQRKIMEFQQKCYFPGGNTLSFSDGDSKGRYRMGLTCHFAMLDPNVEIPPLEQAMHFGEDPCYRWNAAYRDWIWTKQYLNFLKERQEQTVFECQTSNGTFFYLPDAEWAIATGKQQTAFAIKGGNNGEPHNHNDVGSFLYSIGKEEIISDLGAGEYTKDYFGPERYSILCCSSRGHSVPILDGEEQKEGETYRADTVKCSETGKISISFAGAYEKESGKKLMRTAVFCGENGALQIEDCLGNASESTRFTENLVTRQKVGREKDRIRIGSSGILKIDDVSPEKVQIIPCIHKNHAGEAENVFLIQWDVGDKENIRQSRFTLCPAEENNGE